jgi:hypothetical protein
MEEPQGGASLVPEPSFSCDGGQEDRRAKLEAWRAARQAVKGGSSKAPAPPSSQKNLVCKELSTSSVENMGRRESLKRKECPTPAPSGKSLHSMITSTFSTPARVGEASAKKIRATPNDFLCDENHHANTETASSKRTATNLTGAKKSSLATSTAATTSAPVPTSKALPPSKPAPVRAAKAVKGGAPVTAGSKNEDPHSTVWASVDKALSRGALKTARTELATFKNKHQSFRLPCNPLLFLEKSTSDACRQTCCGALLRVDSYFLVSSFSHGKCQVFCCDFPSQHLVILFHLHASRIDWVCMTTWMQANLPLSRITWTD